MVMEMEKGDPLPDASSPIEEKLQPMDTDEDNNDNKVPDSPPDGREHRMSKTEAEGHDNHDKGEGMKGQPMDATSTENTDDGESKEEGAQTQDQPMEANNSETANDDVPKQEEEAKPRNSTTNPNAMALNVAYEALEQVRRANIAIEFGRELGPKECTLCLREPQPTGRFRMPKLNRAAPCLTCGNPVCPRHRCPELKRENINICVGCSQFFALGEFVQKVHACEEVSVRREMYNSMLDVYDRALLVLQYSAQYIDDITTALEYNNKRNDRIGFGSSATGFVSGIAGVAAAATIFTPVGPPLLIASILFGGGATAASASSEAVNYHCNANKMADTIYALHGMVHSISRLALEGRFMEQLAEEGEDVITSTSSSRKGAPKTTQARNWTRATVNAMKPLTAGALSAASVVMEAREMRNTLDKINAGSPCEKADSLRKIAQEMDLLPSTSLLAEIALRFFKLN